MLLPLVYELLLIFFWKSASEEVPVSTIKVSTTLGDIRGLVLQSAPDGRNYYAFLALPYARPPLGSLRFLSPVQDDDLGQGLREKSASSMHNPVFDATKYPPLCPQWTFQNPKGLSEAPRLGQEDCLVLNIFVPANMYEKASNNDSEALPVMVWLHGGAFVGGSSHPHFYGPDHFMNRESVVVVSVNYRLGALGFLALKNTSVSGNMGIKDQTMALQWVQKHIHNFGGDSKRVTIFGESAGGISVMHHILSEQSKGLFSRAIIQSGPLIDASPMRFSKPPDQYGRNFLNQVGCNSSNDALACLQAKPLDLIMEATKMFEKFTFTPNPWKPIIDAPFTGDPFLAAHPAALLENGIFNKVPLMIGATKDEGCLLMIQFMMNPELFTQVNDNFDTLGPFVLHSIDKESPSELERNVSRHFLDHFTRSGQFARAEWKQLKDLFSDVVFLAPIHAAVQLMRQKMDEPIFYYSYRYRGALTLPQFYGYNSSLGDLGVCHGDELFTLFKQRGFDKSDADRKMSEKLIGLWTHFATHEMPSADWRPYDVEEMAVLDENPLRLEDSQAYAAYDKRLMLVAELLMKLRA